MDNAFVMICSHILKSFQRDLKIWFKAFSVLSLPKFVMFLFSLFLKYIYVSSLDMWLVDGDESFALY